MVIIQNSPCPCGSGRAYASCCEPSIAGHTPAATAEALMRSRYTANVIKDVSYLLQSWHPSTRPQSLDVRNIPIWCGLSILQTALGLPGDKQGMVEFIAEYEGTDGRGVLHERSRFVCEDGCWLYVDGEQIAPDAGKSAGKTGRNQPCPCGSGRKYKKCCLKRS